MSMFLKIRRRMMLTCRDVNTFLVAYLDGELDERLARRFEQHVARCAQCSAYLQQYRATLMLIRQAGGEFRAEPPPRLLAETLDFLRERIDDRPASDFL
jgi:anti-sigma factor RsiW